MRFGVRQHARAGSISKRARSTARIERADPRPVRDHRRLRGPLEQHADHVRQPLRLSDLMARGTPRRCEIPIGTTLRFSRFVANRIEFRDTDVTDV